MFFNSTPNNCVFVKRNLEPGCYSVDLGVNDRSKPDLWTTTRSVKKIIIHENFDSKLLRNDIALLSLDVSR